jgi:DNA-binding Lrp family transcriptional regulator
MNLSNLLLYSRQYDESLGIMTITDLDQRLLGLLRGHARMPLADLARKLGVARTTAQARLERLERSGVIAGYSVILGDGAPEVRAHVTITVAPREQASVETGLKRLPELRSLYSVSGPHDLIAVLTAPSTAHLDEALDRIRALPGVTSTSSSIILQRKFERE